ncbi:hypothetical protein KIN20_011201 [Parelaphostrongylus tenuis]|uniref:EGF-like domain-containing protein n=1 Tax=Parelaphostrongylus tenuis TaxID=148309 RepID=A0AAD5QKX2_PARTN|nr:hypothetical protein KIN20_011201 [Parelaphostrongylus tenuis]
MRATMRIVVERNLCEQRETMQNMYTGGYRIILADQGGNTVEQLAPISGMEYAGTDNEIAQSQEVRITRPCPQCTIIFERQALEWGRSYRFRTCADVNVLETISEEDKCNGRGMSTSNGCVCNRGYSGDSCQYMTNCHHDDDCLNGGKCLPEPNSLVVASCYCSYGFFGNNCELSFKREPDNCFAYEMVDDKHFDMYGMFNSSCYNREKFSDDDFVYYRKVKGDVELILDYATTSWVSIGWRPEVLDRSCRLFPDLEGVRSKRSTLAEKPAVSHSQSAHLRRSQTPHEPIAQW